MRLKSLWKFATFEKGTTYLSLLFARRPVSDGPLMEQKQTNLNESKGPKSNGQYFAKKGGREEESVFV